MEKIQIEKSNLKKKLKNNNNEYLSIIYDGFIMGKSPKMIGAELYDMTINGEVRDWNCFEYSIKLVNRIYKRLPKKEDAIEVVNNKYPRYEVKKSDEAISMLVFGLFDLFRSYGGLRKLANESSNDLESKKKDMVIRNVLNNNRGNHKFFYLCSSHKDCAKDHLKAQGKVYYDSDWEKFCDNQEKEIIQKYINSHNVESFQYITGRPVWLITRPNCRHYFKEIGIEELLNESVGDLLKKNNMYRDIGDRQYLQTMRNTKGETSEIIGDYRNAQLMIEKYKDRIDFHKKLYQRYKNPLLLDAIRKDGFLIKKWEEVLRKYKR